MEEPKHIQENSGQQGGGNPFPASYGQEFDAVPGMAPITIAPEAPKMELPKGGGAIKGMGEKFEANAITGTASFSVPVLLTPNPRGMSPNLALSYNSGGGNSPYGLGWQVGIPSISRKTGKGLPRYREAYDADVELAFDEREVNQLGDVFVMAGAEDLVPKLNPDGSRVQRNETIGATNYTVYDYIPRVEGAFMKIERWHTGVNNTSFWKVVDTNNITSLFGESVNTREHAPGKLEKTLTWHLEKRYDALGNVMVFNYQAEDTAGVSASYDAARASQSWSHAKKYPIEIWYGNDAMYDAVNPPTLARDDFRFCLAFNYGQWTGNQPDLDNPDGDWAVRADAFSDYRGGFEIRCWRLCRSVLMYHRFTELGTGWTLTAATRLTHDENPAVSQLTQIVHRMYEGSNWEEYPPIDLTYTRPAISDSLQYMEAADLRNLPGGVDGHRYRWADVYGEGLSGVLCETNNSWYYKPNRAALTDEQGVPELHLENLRKIAEKPRGAVAGASMNLEDIDGDGLPEAIYESASLKGFYKQKSALHTDFGDWLPMQAYESYPTETKPLRKIDLTGNGYADLLLLEGETLTWHPGLGKRGYGTALRQQLDRRESQAPKLVFEGSEEQIYLADMSGDGLSDICRVCNGAVDYWPNLGYGNFGKRISMHVSGGFAAPAAFDPSRLRLLDADGSGSTDILYIGTHNTTLYLNQSGNAFATGQVLSAFPRVDNAATVSHADLLGNGTSCLVWSSPLAAEQGKHLAYLPLMTQGKPYLLVQINNNRGLEQSLSYQPSTQFYLEDLHAGKPWITRLPYAVQCLHKVTYTDHISKLVQVQRYAYHHGYFDPIEREFRGFGMVEQWDTDYEPNASGSLEPVAGETADAIPPIHTKSWYHHGYLQQGGKILDLFADEYYSGDTQAAPLPEIDLPNAWTPTEKRQALYALRGSLLRQEVYADDDSADANKPYTVSQQSYQIQRLQAMESLPYAVFQVLPGEQHSYQYERNASDPRISRNYVLAYDAYGQVTEALSLAFPRRGSGHAAEQSQVQAVYVSTDYIHHPYGSGADAYHRLGVPQAQQQYEVHGLTGSFGESDTLADLQSLLAGASTIAHTDTPSSGVQKRLIGETKNRYYTQNLSGALPEGQVAAHGLPYTGNTLAYTDALRAQLFGTKVAAADLVSAGYDQDGTDFYAKSGRLVFDATKFYLPIQSIDPRGNTASISYDSYQLLPNSSTDALGNILSSSYDYRLLQPEEITDPNGNREQVAFDVLGRPSKLWRKGKSSENLGDTNALPGTLFNYAFFDALNEIPNRVHTQQREEHADSNARILESFTYSDGAERIVLEKVMAEPEQGSSDPRWVGSGRVAFNNKGWPVRQYEPYFASTPDYETEASQRTNGVSSILSYDSLGRTIRVDMPDGTFSKVEFNPWEQKDYDANDTVVDSTWYVDRNSPNAGGSEPTDPDERAAWLAAQHYDTPKRSHFDTLGRAFLVQDDNGSYDGSSTTHDDIDTQTHLDITGRRTGYTNALGQQTTFAYAIHARNSEDEQGQAQPAPFNYTQSPDKGSQWMLNDLMGLPYKRWDSRNHVFRYTYDALNRPLESYVDVGGGEMMLEKRVYGEALGDSLNHRGQLYELYDQSGRTRILSYDFKGNVIQSVKQFVQY